MRDSLMQSPSHSTSRRSPMGIRASAIVGFCSVLALAAQAKADVPTLQLMDSTVTANVETQTVTFSLLFDRAPVLQSYDSLVNAADEFSIDLLNAPISIPSLHGFGGEDLRIMSSTYRDVSVALNGGRVPTPTGFAAITTPRYSGTELQSLIPFTVNGSVVSFSASFEELGETDGIFEAVLHTYRYGAWNGYSHEIGTIFGPVYTSGGAVPEPASMLALGFGAMALLVRRSRA